MPMPISFPLRTSLEEIDGEDYGGASTPAASNSPVNAVASTWGVGEIQRPWYTFAHGDGPAHNGGSQRRRGAL